MKNSTAVFIGEQTLLIQCCEHWLAKDCRIISVVSKNEVIVQWAQARNITVHLPNSDYIGALKEVQYDYLFSITNLNILPKSLLDQPAIDSINFHDGPLPSYAGINAPAWAIANGESEHGVTFHRMMNDVDSGEVLCQRIFPISENETTFSLNVKCYQIAEDLFHELVEILNLELTPTITGSGRQWSYFGLGKKPGSAGVVNFNDDAETLDKFFRSVDYGPYANPLSYPKFKLPTGEYAFAREANVKIKEGTDSAGTILTVENGKVTIACNGGAVTFKEVLRLDGEIFKATSLGVHIGAVIPQLEKYECAELSDWDKLYGRYESTWHHHLRVAEPVQLPYVHIGTSAQNTYVERVQNLNIDIVSIVKGMSENGSTLAAALGLYFARIAGKSTVTIASVVAEIGQKNNVVAELNSTCVPVTVSYGIDQSAQNFIAKQSALFSSAKKIGSYNNDLYAREPDLYNVIRCDQYQVLIREGNFDNIQGNHLLIIDIDPDQNLITWRFRVDAFNNSDMERMCLQFEALLADISMRGESAASKLKIISDDDRALMFGEWNATTLEYDKETTIHKLFEKCVADNPDVVAVEFEGSSVTYRDLNIQANRLASLLLTKGLGDGQIIGVLVDRSIEMITTLLGVLKSGSAYLPLDPVYPADRLKFMVADSKAAAVVLNDHYSGLLEDTGTQLVKLNGNNEEIKASRDENPDVKLSSTNLCYLIYTSGSTGRPKGVMVEHKNVVNFFIGMDQRVESGPGKWLAVTSISFDISVLEIFWTLGRGFTLLLYSDEKRQQSDVLKAQSKYPDKHLDLSFFYWNVADDDSLYIKDKYRLLLEGAKFADKNGFKAVWNPERHFASFGGLFPNPAVTLGALSTITENVELRAGSCVVPLHSPIRVAEEYSIVDNLSNGRVGIAAASGWAPPDFAIKPENFENAKGKMFDSVEVVRKLWRGEHVPFDGPNGEVQVRTLPRPSKLRSQFGLPLLATLIRLLVLLKMGRIS